LNPAFTDYPEFFLAGAMLLLVWFSARSKVEWTWPSWLSNPARLCVLSMPNQYLSWLQKSLLFSDWRSNHAYDSIACFKVYSPLLALAVAPFLPLYGVLAAAVILFSIPDAVLAIAVARRQQEIRRSLPQALDLMVLCVDAGLGLDATLQRIAADGNGIANALNDELNLLCRDILLGRDREHAYSELYIRTGVDELKTLGSALSQANKLGLSIGRILRAQSEFMRKRQSQRAEEKAMKMPIYMAFPLWFFIMPALMLLVLGPSLTRFYHSLQLAARPF